MASGRPEPAAAGEADGRPAVHLRCGVTRHGPTSDSFDWARTSNCYRRRQIQPVNATVWLNISAGVRKPSVFLGLSFNCLATALSLACE